MATNNMNNLTTLIKRLEAATSRLEDMVSSTVENTPKTVGSLAAATSTTSISSETLSPASNETSTRGMPTPQQAQAPPPAPAPPKPAAEELPASVEEYDHFLSTTVKKYVDVSAQLGGKVAEQAKHVQKTFEEIRKYLLVATMAKKPDVASSEFASFLGPLQKSAGEVNNIKDSGRGDALFNHLSAVADSIGVISWVMLERKPESHVDESLGSAKYYGNRVQKEFKDKEGGDIHLEWLKAYYAIFTELSQFIKDTYPRGVVWNGRGTSLKEAVQSLSSASSSSAPPAPPAPSAGGPPPPPPPPPGPAPRFEINEAPSSSAIPTGGLGAVFSELNKGSAVTAGLKKVSAAEMTHKNPSLRASSVVPTRSDSLSSETSINRARSPAPRKTPKPEGLRAKKPPKKELQGNKWIVENFENEEGPVEIEAEISHSILVSRCSKTTIIVKGKANAITVDNSTRLSLVIDSLVSSVDVIKSANFALQVLGTLPTILMDQVDGAQVYLSKDSLNTEVFSSKCSGVNLNIMEDDVEDADYKEIALPEQIRTWIEGGKVRSEIVEHAG